jgi:hypothetical protein
MAAIDPGRGPIPNRWSASAASAFAELLLMALPRPIRSRGAPVGRAQLLKYGYVM